MDFESLIKSIPLILNMFVPGFIFIGIYNKFNNERSYSFEYIAVTSVVLSYVFGLFTELLAGLIIAPQGLKPLITILLSVIFALLFVKMNTTNIMKKIYKIVGKVTGNDSIWKDIFDINAGSRLRCFITYDGSIAKLEGAVKYYEYLENGECSIVLVNYTITQKSGVLSSGDNEDLLFYINTKSVSCLEVMQG